MTPVKQKRRFNWAGKSPKNSQEIFGVFSAAGGCFRDKQVFS
jgi:hypothetical protein